MQYLTLIPIMWLQVLALVPILWLITHIIYVIFNGYWNHDQYISYVRMSRKSNSPEVKRQFLEFAKPHRNHHIKYVINTYGTSLFLFISIFLILL